VHNSNFHLFLDLAFHTSESTKIQYSSSF
jgi:hypothetical protein